MVEAGLAREVPVGTRPFLAAGCSNSYVMGDMLQRCKIATSATSATI